MIHFLSCQSGFSGFSHQKPSKNPNHNVIGPADGNFLLVGDVPDNCKIAWKSHGASSAGGYFLTLTNARATVHAVAG
jgi:hypothetical protein